MIYKNIIQAKFIERPNRFIALCEINKKVHKCHVKNTGRCKELLIKNCTVYLEPATLNSNRTTEFSLIAVQSQTEIINIDSQIPNKIVYDAILNGTINLPTLKSGINKISREKQYKNSRFDIFLETDSQKVFIEVKGVTLKQGNKALFPDAPTKRGLKHINELINATQNGYDSYIIFLIQMTYIDVFTPNYGTDKDFGLALKNAQKEGVNILAFNCYVTPDDISIKSQVSIEL
ncbi:MAG: DNA/RNA nuclease SfsA [Oscillospiraceae bacterium]